MRKTKATLMIVKVQLTKGKSENDILEKIIRTQSIAICILMPRSKNYQINTFVLNDHPVKSINHAAKKLLR